jgi:hypothetical protein
MQSIFGALNKPCCSSIKVLADRHMKDLPAKLLRPFAFAQATVRLRPGYGCYEKLSMNRAWQR